MTNLWLQNLPERWKVLRLKRVVQLSNLRSSGSSIQENYIGLENIEPWTGKLFKSTTNENIFNDENEKESTVSCFEPGNILFGKLRPYLAKAYLSQEYGICTTELLVLNPSEVLFGRFLLYVLLTPEFINLVNAETFGAKMPRADWNTIGNILIPLPSLSEQRAIANYLDHETAKIEKLISAKERLLDLLTEKRQSLITHVITCGLNPDVPMRDSGVEWIGNIPQHWEVEHLKYHISQIEQGWSPQCDNFPADEDEWGVLKVGAVNAWEFNPYENKRLPTDLKPLTEYEIKPGDILISRANTTELVGSAALVDQVRSKLILCDKLYRLKMYGNRLYPEYLVFYLRSIAGRFEFERDATGASNSMQNISQEIVTNLWIPIPPIDEQNQIVDHIKANVLKLDNLTVAAKRTIELLQERRTALITAAVTGQIKVTA